MRMNAVRRPPDYEDRALQVSATGAEQGGTSRKISEVIVNTLGRDHTLRHAYLRERWQGLRPHFHNKGEASRAPRPR